MSFLFCQFGPEPGPQPPGPSEPRPWPPVQHVGHWGGQNKEVGKFK